MFFFSRYNKRINDIRECKEQALSHAYVHKEFSSHLFLTYFYSFIFLFVFLLFVTLVLALLLPSCVSLSGSLTQANHLLVPFIPHSVVSCLILPPLPPPSVSHLLLSSLLILSSPFISSFFHHHCHLHTFFLLS